MQKLEYLNLVSTFMRNIVLCFDFYFYYDSVYLHDKLHW